MNPMMLRSGFAITKSEQALSYAGMSRRFRRPRGIEQWFHVKGVSEANDAGLELFAFLPDSHYTLEIARRECPLIAITDFGPLQEVLPEIHEESKQVSSFA